MNMKKVERIQANKSKFNPTHRLKIIRSIPKPMPEQKQAQPEKMKVEKIIQAFRKYLDESAEIKNEIFEACIVYLSDESNAKIEKVKRMSSEQIHIKNVNSVEKSQSQSFYESDKEKNPKKSETPINKVPLKITANNRLKLTPLDKQLSQVTSSHQRQEGKENDEKLSRRRSRTEMRNTNLKKVPKTNKNLNIQAEYNITCEGKQGNNKYLDSRNPKSQFLQEQYNESLRLISVLEREVFELREILGKKGL